MKVVLSILVFSATVYSQRLYVGVKGGTPLSDSMASAFVGGRGGSGLSTLNVRRYTLGPTVELRVWRNISVEADALYKRLDRTEHRFFAPTFGSIDRLTASSWELPFLLKYSCPKLKFQPFVAAGGAVRVFLPAEASTETIATGFQPPRSVTRYDPDWTMTQGGYAGGGGVRFATFHGIKMTPELRYTRWTSETMLPTRNQVEFFLGLGF